MKKQYKNMKRFILSLLMLISFSITSFSFTMNDGQKPNAEVSIFQDVGIDMAVCVNDYNFYMDDYNVVVNKSEVNQSSFHFAYYNMKAKNVFKPVDVGKIQAKITFNYKKVGKQLVNHFNYRNARDGLSCNC